jgi:hypothetical protein
MKRAQDSNPAPGRRSSSLLSPPVQWSYLL